MHHLGVNLFINFIKKNKYSCDDCGENKEILTKDNMLT